jgi:hypothetical protein
MLWVGEVGWGVGVFVVFVCWNMGILRRCYVFVVGWYYGVGEVVEFCEWEGI